LEVLLADGEGQVARIALDLVRGCGPDGGIEGNVGGFAVSRPSLNVAPPLAVGASLAAATALATRQLIEVGVKLPLNFEFGPRFGLLATLPPMRGIVVLELRLLRQFLRGRFGGFLLGGVFV